MKIDTNDDGEIDIKTVVEHIKAIEAGSGKNTWVRDNQRDVFGTRQHVLRQLLSLFKLQKSKTKSLIGLQMLS